MTRIPHVIAILTTATILAVFGGVAEAESITILNPSFEDPVVNPGQWLQPPTDWTLVGNYFGVFRAAGEFGQDAAPTDGNQVAFFNVEQADGRQDLTDAYQPGLDYVLAVDISARAPYGADQDMDLILSGHTHGGQVRIPLLGPLTTMTSIGKKFVSGMYREGGSLVYVSRGFGTSAFPIRLFCRPEITVFNFE